MRGSFSYPPVPGEDSLSSAAGREETLHYIAEWLLRRDDDDSAKAPRASLEADQRDPQLPSNNKKMVTTFVPAPAGQTRPPLSLPSSWES
jgi:hypothetical protein